MALSAVLNWFGRSARPVEDAPHRPVATQPVRGRSAEPVRGKSDEPPPGPARPPLPWTRDRLIATDALWGEGFQFPGGEVETLRLAKPLGVSTASSLLLLGAGSGGPACSVATKLGAWVSGFESDPDLLSAAIDRIARKNLTKRAHIEAWNPKEPAFRKHFHHHCLAIEALHGALPERTLSAIADSLMPGGQLMMVELVADSPLDPANRLVASWARLECRDPRAIPREEAITRTLGRLGFDVRVVEDVTQRQVHQALTGWRNAVRNMERNRPTRREAMRHIQEAELWMLRLRLFQPGWLRLVRWHAIGAAG
jgi:cyclopropane fatty-acyl-phospholipid synthase-like methyltransferase